MGGDSVAVIAAGLPNITARLGIAGLESYTSGAIYTTTGHTVGWYQYQNIDQYFDASRSNSIYGNSETVMPAAIQLVAQIKY